MQHSQRIKIGGRFYWWAQDRKTGLLRALGIWHNGITTAGLTAHVDAFRVAIPTSWYVGLISNTSYTGVAAGDTMSSHAGWTEFTGYSQAARPQWVPGAAAAGVIINPARFTFSFTSLQTIKGAFLVSDSTKGGASGTLWATALNPDGDLQLQADENLVGQYQLTEAQTGT